MRRERAAGVPHEWFRMAWLDEQQLLVNRIYRFEYCAVGMPEVRRR